MIKYREKSSNFGWTNWRDFPLATIKSVEYIKQYYRKTGVFEVISDLPYLFSIKIHSSIYQYWDTSENYNPDWDLIAINENSIPDWLK